MVLPCIFCCNHLHLLCLQFFFSSLPACPISCMPFSNATFVYSPITFYLLSSPLCFFVSSFSSVKAFFHFLFFSFLICLLALNSFIFFCFLSSPSLLSFTCLSSLSLSSPLPFQHVYIMSSPQACEIPETAVFSMAPSEDSSLAKPRSVPCWDLVQTSVPGKVEYPLPLRHMLFSLFPRPDAGVGSAAWSLPAPIRPDFPRQSLSIPGEPDSGTGLSSRWV